ncbi:hypothetical protein PLICRDRAFT_174791 [Plicaturopsis crispa FD-325 SS-3]|nr:hypothetical protein PLICRDRAFT_174791 [Plicaturopsis crispa FD-325 SS-3]
MLPRRSSSGNKGHLLHPLDDSHDLKLQQLQIIHRTPPPVTPIFFPTDTDSCSSAAAAPMPSKSIPIPRKNTSRDHHDDEHAHSYSDQAHIDRLWDQLRHRKEAKEARSAPKVESFGALAAAGSRPPLVKIASSPPLHRDRSPPPQDERVVRPLAGPSKKAKSFDMQTLEGKADTRNIQPACKPEIGRRKSHSSSNFRESSDGRTVTATFDMHGTHKSDVHVSYQRTRLVVTWQVVHVTESSEPDGTIVRERREQMHDRVIPLPDGTRFDQISAAMTDGRHLILTYPAMRPLRTRSPGRRPKSRDAHVPAPAPTEISNW